MRRAASIREFAWLFSLVVCVVLGPVWADAQTIKASVTGVVTDSSGAVLPGVTVEVTSPALIEKARTAVTDGSGSYRIVELETGTYTVTFTLSGFSPVKREGLELAGSLMATVSAELRVGTVEETITVSAESPIVDVQSSRQTQVIDISLWPGYHPAPCVLLPRRRHTIPTAQLLGPITSATTPAEPSSSRRKCSDIGCTGPGCPK